MYKSYSLIKLTIEFKYTPFMICLYEELAQKLDFKPIYYYDKKVFLKKIMQGIKGYSKIYCKDTV